MSRMNVTSLRETMRDFYPRAGERLKQYVVDMRRENAWESATCPRVDLAGHEDNTGARCRNEGPTLWTHLDHDCCETCGRRHIFERSRSDITAWIVLRDARPPIEADHANLSDEIEPDRSLEPHPMLAMFAKGRP